MILNHFVTAPIFMHNVLPYISASPCSQVLDTELDSHCTMLHFLFHKVFSHQNFVDIFHDCNAFHSHIIKKKFFNHWLYNISMRYTHHRIMLALSLLPGIGRRTLSRFLIPYRKILTNGYIQTESLSHYFIKYDPLTF